MGGIGLYIGGKIALPLARMNVAMACRGVDVQCSCIVLSLHFRVCSICNDHLLSPLVSPIVSGTYLH